MAMQKSSGLGPVILEDMTSDVHCPVCSELYEDPQALLCQDTLCSKCLPALINSEGNVVCPKCKAETPKDKVAQSLATKKLVDVFKQGTEAAQKKSELKPDQKCEYCELKTAEVFCNNCVRAVCENCERCHVKLSRCEDEHAERIENESNALKEILAEMAGKIAEEQANMASRFDEGFATSFEAAFNECLDDLDHAKETLLEEVRQLFAKEEQKIRDKFEEKTKSTIEGKEDILAKARELLSEISDACDAGDVDKLGLAELMQKAVGFLHFMKTRKLPKVEHSFQSKCNILQVLSDNFVVNLRFRFDDPWFTMKWKCPNPACTVVNCNWKTHCSACETKRPAEHAAAVPGGYAMAGNPSYGASSGYAVSSSGNIHGDGHTAQGDGHMAPAGGHMARGGSYYGGGSHIRGGSHLVQGGSLIGARGSRHLSPRAGQFFPSPGYHGGPPSAAVAHVASATGQFSPTQGCVDHNIYSGGHFENRVGHVSTASARWMKSQRGSHSNAGEEQAPE